ncbi:MAG: hypothetical protein IPM51_10675 [Sphingobacteriaceae bacterium]|nr:hypothetical protein [Sphingobacteriaceae bacterium]
MDDASVQKEWDRFSKSIGGRVEKRKENYSNPDNIYRIVTDKNTIELTWANRPQKGRGFYLIFESLLTYELTNSETIKLKVQPTDFLSKIFSFLTQSRKKTGIKELDNAYIFICNSDSLILELTDEFISFYKNNTYKNFNIEIETITDKRTLRIFIPELLTSQEKLEYYYNFGQRIAKIIDGGKH